MHGYGMPATRASSRWSVASWQAWFQKGGRLPRPFPKGIVALAALQDGVCQPVGGLAQRAWLD